MREQRIGSLPVVDRDRVVGIIIGTDVLRVFQNVLDKGVVSKPYRWAFAYR
jgi:CBS domain-containing protein